MAENFLTKSGFPKKVCSWSSSFSLPLERVGEDKLKLELLAVLRVGLMVLCFLVLLSRATAVPEITLDWSAKKCLPGDVVTLRVRVTSANITGFDLKLPNDEAVEWVSHERGPVLYRAGVYAQEDTVVAQPTHPGTIALKEIHAVVRDGETTSDQVLSLSTLVVGSFGDLTDDFKPEPLPAKTLDVGIKNVWWLWITAAFVGVGAMVFIFCREPPEIVEKIEKKSVSEELVEIFQNEEIPLPQIERVLAERSPELSVEMRVALEEAVYRRTPDLKKIRMLLEMEAAR